MADRYSLLQPDVWQTVQEHQRHLLRLWAELGWHDNIAQRHYTEVGCGAGGQLLECLRAGFLPEHLTGIELQPARHAMARQRLPERVALYLGDAADAPIEPASQDMVAQHTVFSSVLDPAQQQRIADAMWRWTKPGGGVLWYDFTVDNPRNPAVRGVPLQRVRALFPQAGLQARRITLAPPLARAVCRAHPALYTVLNALLLLRTHLFVWLRKP
jgi:SAM-dependent methyltransferase